MSDEPQRPNPDELLSRVQADERQQARGKLKIFLGYAAGVGKTYAMLEAAHQRLAEGVDVVAAYVETHGRPETEALLAGLETLPRQQVEYRGRVLPELDLDAVLARRPSAGAGRRAGPYQRAGTAPPQALPGRGRDPGRRHRRLYHPQHPAPGKPERRRGPDHRRHGPRDDPRPGDRRNDRSGADRPAAGRATAQARRKARSTSLSRQPRPSASSSAPAT